MDFDSLRPILIPRLRAAIEGRPMPKLSTHNLKTLSRASRQDIERFMVELVLEPVCAPLESYLKTEETEEDASVSASAEVEAESGERVPDLTLMAEALAGGADPS